MKNPIGAVGRGKAFIFVILAVVLVLTLTVCAALLGVRPSTDGGTAHAETSAPFRIYTSLEPTSTDGYELYRGVTTVKGLKKNLTVTGKTEDGDYTLTTDEYVIKRDGVALAATDYIVGADETDTESVILQIESGNAIADISLNVAADAPAAVSDLTVTAPTSISDDHTADTVHKVITVSDGETTLRSDLYTVELLGSDGSAVGVLTAGQQVQIKVTTFDGQTKTASGINVTAAALIGVDLRVAEDISLDGLYYKRNGKDVFVRGSSNREVFENNLVITAIYENSRKTVTPAYNQYDALSGATDNSYGLSINNQGVIGDDEANRTVTISLSRNNGSVYSASLNINFAEVAIVEIGVNADAFASVLSSDKYSGKNRNSYTTLQLADFMSGSNPAIVFVRNNGTTTTTVPAGATAAFVGNLAPTAKDVIAYESASDKDNFTYSRDVKVQFTAANGNVVTSEPITVSDIYYATPSGMSNSISGTFATQTMHHEFDYSGLTVTVMYNNDWVSVDFNLSDFFDADNPENTKKFLTTYLYDSDAPDATPVEGTVVTKDTKMVSVKFTYGSDSTKAKRGLLDFGLDIVKDPVTAPELDTSPIVYTNGCYKAFKDVSQLHYGAAEFGHDNVMDVSLYSDASLTAPVSAEYAEYADGRISFYSGGTYYVKVALGANADEYTLTTSSNITISPDGSYAVYPIVVTKGTLAIGIDNVTDKIYYGDYPDTLNPKIKVNGAIGGVRYELVESGAGDGQLEVPYKLVYIKADADNYDPANYDYDSYTAPAVLDAGRYHVYAITRETNAYLASKSRVGGYITVEILKKELSFSSVAEQTYTRGTSFKVSDFITSSGNFAYSDTADQVLTVAYTGTDASVTVVDGKPTFTHKGEYPVTLGISAAYAKNYVLAETQASTLSFIVNQRSLTLTANASGWTYGDASPNPNAQAYKGSPFYATVKAAEYFAADASGKPTGAAIDVAAQPFETWAVGNYVAVFETEYDEAYPDEATYEDYDLPTATKAFAVTAKKINKITISDSGWSNTQSGANWIGQYGTAITATLSGYDADNTAPSSSDNIVTVTVAGTRLAPDAAQAIDDLDTAFDYGTGKLTLTQAGNYTVTVSLNKNYTWTDNSKDDIVYYGDIYKRYLTGLSLSSDVVYNGEKQTASVTVSDNGGGAGWATDAFDASAYVLSVKSVVGTSLAADGIALGAGDISQSSGTFDVKYAGAYAVTIEINDKYNYEFNDGDTSTAAARVADRELTFTVGQAAFKAVWDGVYGGGSTIKYEFDEGKESQQIPVGTPDVEYAADNAELTVLSAQVYTDADCTQAVTGNAVKASGTYYIRVTAIGGGAKDNYYLPTDDAELGYITVRFDIESGALVIPTLTVGGTAVEVEFKGDAYAFSDYIDNFAANYINGDITRVVIKVDGIVTESMRDVKLDGDEVDVYGVTVEPAENYAWDTENCVVPNNDAQHVFEFTFKITQLKVELSWSNVGASGGFVYGDGKAHTPSVSFDNNKDGAAAALKLSYSKKNDSAVIADTSGTADAGEYTATVALDGDKIGNYTLDGVTVTAPFTVLKKALGTPAANGASLTYDGTVQTVAYGWTDYNGKATGSVVGVNNNVGVPDEYKSLGNCAFDSATGELTFLHAGKYTVTFTLTAESSKNYCWTNGGADKFDADVETTTTDELNVARQELLAPALGDQRAIELVTGTSLVLPNNINDGDAVDGVKYSVAYGIYNPDTAAWNVQELTSTSRGTVYFVKLTVDGTKNSLVAGNFSPYDYLWVENSANDAEGMSFVATLGGVYGAVSADGIDMYLSFVITKQQVGALFAFEGYTFGDNGCQDGATRTFSDEGLTFDKLFADSDKENAGNTLKLTYLPDTNQYHDNAQSMLEWIAKAKAVVSVEFYDETGTTLVTDLVNGLPWNQGVYIARVNVKFNDADAYNDFANDAEFTVSKLLAEVEWSDTDRAVYNGEGQTRGATVVNLPQKESGKAIAAPALTVTKVTDVVWSGDSPAAQTVTITGISDENYTIDGLVNKSSAFTITPKPIAVTGTDVLGHVYGDTVKDGEKAFTVDHGYAFEDDGEYVTVEILDADGNAVTALSDVGTYRVVPGLLNVYGNYKLSDDANNSLVTEGEFTVVARSLTVTFGSVSSVYGDSLVNLYDAATVKSSNGEDDFGYVAGQSLGDIVTIRAVDGASNAVTEYSHVTDAEHAYKITCALVGGVSNYALDAFGEFAYVITPAEITVNKADGYTGVYDAAEHNIFDIAARAVNDPAAPDANALKVMYSADKNTWTEYTVTDGVASARVRNVSDALNGEYFIKITAENHNDYITATAKRVEVTKATLTVTVNIGIYYGENSPLDYDGGGHVFDATVAALRTAGGIYTIDAQDFKGDDRALFYGDGAFYGLAQNASSTMTYVYNGAAYNKGDAAREYSLMFVAGDLACENYKFVAAEGKLTVSALPVSIEVNNGESLTAIYNQENPPVPEITSITTAAVSVYDGNTVEIYGIGNFADIATVVNPALDAHAEGVTTNAAREYDVTVQLKANYVLADGGYTVITYTIERAINKITTEDYSLFVNAVSQKAEAPATAAWTYGDYDGAHTTGYNPEGDHALNPVALLNRDNNITIKLTRMYNNQWDKRVTVAPDGDINAALAKLFADTHAAEGFQSFYAGTYSVEFNMEQSENYNAFSERWVFTVDKQTLEIAPVNSSVVYGEDVSTRELAAGVTPTDDADGDYPYSVYGLVKNNGVLDALSGVVTFVISSDYAAGYDGGSVGTYNIRAASVTGVDNVVYDGDTYTYVGHNNYTVKFRTGTLTVTARQLSVAVDDVTNYYNFIHYVTAADGSNGHYDENERFDGYTFAVTGGSFADGDGVADGNTVFTLDSVAVTGETTTADVGEYPIYLMPKNGGHYYSALDGVTPNYIITVKDGYTGGETIPDDAITQNAGTHTVVKAIINVTIDDMPYTDEECEKPFGSTTLVYDGAVKYFKAEYSLPSNMNQTAPGTLLYYEGTRNSHTLLGDGSSDYAPKNAERYYVEYKLTDDKNFSAPTAYKEYAIAKKTIAVTPRSVSNSAGAFVSIAGVYYFNGGYFTYGIDFSGLIAGENSYLTYALERTLYADSTVAEGDKDAFMTFDPTVENSGFSFRVRNSGAYAATVTLADRGDFLADNYMFANGTDEFEMATFVIAPDTLYVDTKATSVEYGYALGSVSGDRLGVEYRSMNYADRTSALIEAERGMTVNGNAFLSLPAEFNAGMFDSDDYNPTTSKWGNKYDLTLKASEITAYNFVVVPRGTDVLSIDSHKLTVEVKGYDDGVDIASCVYAGADVIDGQSEGHNPHVSGIFGDNRTAFLEIRSDNGGFKAPSDYKDPFGSVSLRIPNGARNVGKYPLAPSQDKTAYPMYDITFVNADGAVIESNLEDSANAAKLPKWYISPATLKIAVGQYAANVSYVNLIKSFSVPYGTDITYDATAATSTFAIRYSGWVNATEGNDFGAIGATHSNHAITRCNVEGASGVYAPWTSIAGSVFTVTPVIGDLSYTNYTIVVEEATVRIAPLSVFAESSRIEYREATNPDGSKKYNGGKSGATHDVSLAFTSAANGIALPESGFAPFAYAVSYKTSTGAATSAGVNADSAYGAPTVVGMYRAEVTFKTNANGEYNYTFADGENAANTVKTFEHEVYKQTVVLSWLDDVMTSGSAQVNTVNNYVRDIMDVVAFALNDAQVAGGDYTVDANGFKVNVPDNAVGTYRLTVRFNADAAKNYCWDTSDEDKIISFKVSLAGNIVDILNLAIDDWTFDAAESEPTAELSHPSLGGRILFTYALAGNIDIDGILGGVNNRDVPSAIGGSLLYNATPRYAGWYVLCASYSYGEYSAANKYYLFKIDKATVGAPVLGIVTEGEGKNDMYNGNRLSADVTHSEQAYVEEFAYDRSVIAGGTRLFVLNANESGYTVRFALKDYANYMWDEVDLGKYDGIELVRNDKNEITSVILRWVVKKADKHEIIWNASAIWNAESSRYELIYGDSYSVTARSTYSTSVRYGYAADTGEGYEGISDWSSVLPTAAGSYFVRVECDGNDNYVSALAYRAVYIGRATLTATPFGSIVYGDAFSVGACDFRLSGYRNSVRPEIKRDNSLIEYMLADGTLDKNNLDAGEYVLLMRVDKDGFVLGVTLDNYNVVLATDGGAFTVECKRVAVKVGDASGVYLENINLDSVTLSVTSGMSSALTTAQIKQMLGITLSTTANSASTVGRYAITAAADNGNYAVEFTDGEYTVTELRVRVEISAGGGEYDGVITDAVVTHIYTVNASEQKDLIGDDILEFSYRYSGRSYSGVAASGTTRPTLAGMYIATVTGITNNANYILDLSAGDVSVPFVITRKVINAGKLVIESKPYTGSAIEPTIEDNFYNIDGNVIYTVMPHADFVDGGTYSFTLRLADADNYRWMSVEDGVAERGVSFTITKAQNALVADVAGQTPTIKIAGWTFGQFDAAKNMPQATVKFGNELIVYTYASHRDGPYTTAVPTDGKAGEYWVRVTVRETDNYKEFVSEPVSFVISKLLLTAPTLQVVTDGEGRNDTYTGGELSSLVLGFDSVLMGVYYDGSVNINGSRVTVFAVNAGEYAVKISLKDPVSYGWAEGTQTDEDGNAVLGWTVARKKLAKPTDSKKTLVVNGKILEYLPDGFDASTMRITGNKSGYGGTFTATVELIDTDNYVWADDTVAPVEYEWQVVGAHTVFIAVIGSLGGVAGALAVVAAVQFALVTKKKRAARGEEVSE